MTVGISPKVALPAILQLVVGLALVVLGVIVGDTTVRDAGIGMLAGAGVTGAAGYAAPAGAITTNVGRPNDELLDEHSRTRLTL